MDEQLQLIDLGDAVMETRQTAYYPFVPDSVFGTGMHPD